MKHSILALTLCLALSGCSLLEQKETQPETVEETDTDSETEKEAAKVYNIRENAWYVSPEDPTEYIAQTYNALTKLLPEVELEEEEEAQPELETEGLQSKTGGVLEVEPSLYDQELPEVEAADEDLAKAAMAYFLADFFTLSNKEDESQIGALDLIPSDSAADFREYAKYYYYNNLPVIAIQKGRDQLPEVTDVVLSAQKAGTFEYLGQEYDGYSFKAAITYKPVEDASEFKTNVKCTIIKMQDVHYVDTADVSSDISEGIPHEVWRVIAVTD